MTKHGGGIPSLPLPIALFSLMHILEVDRVWEKNASNSKNSEIAFGKRLISSGETAKTHLLPRLFPVRRIL